MSYKKRAIENQSTTINKTNYTKNETNNIMDSFCKNRSKITSSHNQAFQAAEGYLKQT